MRATAPRWRSVAASVVLFALVSGAAAVAAWPVAASANHIKAQFPSMNGGTLWMSRRLDYSGIQFITSSMCPATENTAFSRIKSSTTGKPEMTRWTNGIQMSQQRCDNVWDFSMDIRISYMDQSNFLQPDGHYIGGRNVDVQASSEYCAYWGTYYPCGSRPNVQLNRQKFQANSSAYQISLITHETGHSLGLAHHCTSASIMNDGGSACFGGRFGDAPGYFATDRSGINNVYP